MRKEKKQAVGSAGLDAYFEGKTAEGPESKDTNTSIDSNSSNDISCFAIRIPRELQDRIRDIAYWDRESLADLAEAAFKAEIERREEKRGETYPTRDKKLKPGRPVK